MATKILELHVPLLEGLEVTGKDEPPALECSAYSFQHLSFLGTGKAKLTGKITILVDIETAEVVPIGPNIPIPAIEFEVASKQWNGNALVLPHRIQLVPKKKSTERK